MHDRSNSVSLNALHSNVCSRTRKAIPHQSRHVADFLLAWWNAGESDAYPITTAWGVDDEIADDMVTVFRLAVHARSYPDTFGYGPQFEAIMKAWRPELIAH